MRERALLMCFLLFTAALSGCFGKEEITTVEEDLPQDVRTFVTGPDGLPVDVPLLPFEFNFSDVGEDGPEPSIGVTSSGCIFFIGLLLRLNVGIAADLRTDLHASSFPKDWRWCGWDR